ncbi:MAG: rod shape-determining protein RodA [Parcubacteria group bacterium]|jgi:rod shape determining protein RodA
MLKKIFIFDWVLVAAVLFLTGISLLALYGISAAGFNEANIIWKQLFFAFVGISAMAFFSRIDYHYLRSYSRPIYFTTVIVLILVLLLGNRVHGTSGWLGLGIFNVQPVEFAKVALIIFLASFISSKKIVLGEAVQLVASMILTAVIVFLVIKQPDFGSAMVLLGIWIGMAFFSGINKKILAVLLGIGILAGAATWFNLADYQKARIVSFANPEFDIKGSGYNVFQSIVSVGSGGMTGKGIGQGSQSQLDFLPESHTDFIFATVTEELGFLGAMLVLFLYAVLFYQMRKIALLAPDNFGYLLTSGIMIMLFTQLLINIGMNIGLVPVAGIPLPFLSYGGSSLVACFVAVGIVLNIYNKRTIADSKVMQSY